MAKYAHGAQSFVKIINLPLLRKVEQNTKTINESQVKGILLHFF